jgi:hypothetical protein
MEPQSLLSPVPEPNIAFRRLTVERTPEVPGAGAAYRSNVVGPRLTVRYRASLWSPQTAPAVVTAIFWGNSLRKGESLHYVLGSLAFLILFYVLIGWWGVLRRSWRLEIAGRELTIGKTRVDVADIGDVFVHDKRNVFLELSNGEIRDLPICNLRPEEATVVRDAIKSHLGLDMIVIVARPRIAEERPLTSPAGPAGTADGEQAEDALATEARVDSSFTARDPPRRAVSDTTSPTSRASPRIKS